MDQNTDTNNPIHSFLSKIIDEAIATLHDSYCIAIDEDQRALTPTSLGRIASFYYLSHKTVQLFQDNLNENITLEELLELVTKVSAFCLINFLDI